MYDFKTFAQMNLDLIFKGFDRLPQPGEEVFAKSFTLQLGGGPIVCPIVLEQLGCRVRLGTFMGLSSPPLLSGLASWSGILGQCLYKPSLVWNALFGHNPQSGTYHNPSLVYGERRPDPTHVVYYRCKAERHFYPQGGRHTLIVFFYSHGRYAFKFFV